MPNTHATLTSLFSDIADAIREKTGDTAQIVADNFPAAIEDISGGGGIEYVEGEFEAGTVPSWNTYINHNAGWERYLYVIWADNDFQEAPTGATRYVMAYYMFQRGDNTAGIDTELFFPHKFNDLAGAAFGFDGAGGKLNRSAATDSGATTNKVRTSGGAAYSLSQEYAYKWRVFNMEGLSYV